MLGMLEHARLSLATLLVLEQAGRGSTRWRCDTERPQRRPQRAPRAERLRADGTAQLGTALPGCKLSLWAQEFSLLPPLPFLPLFSFASVPPGFSQLILNVFLAALTSLAGLDHKAL